MNGSLAATRALVVQCLALAAVLSLAGCCDTESDERERDFPYPLDIGNRWEYQRQVWISDPSFPAKVGAALGDTTYYSECTVEVVRIDSLSPSVDGRALHEVEVEGTSTSGSESWYTNEPDGLYFHAYTLGASAVAPRDGRGPAFILAGLPISDIRHVPELIDRGHLSRACDPDSIIYEDPPLRTFPYPPQVGYEWMYREPENPWHIDKRITGTANIGVPAGQFDCYEVQWLIDVNADGQWDDDIVWFDYVAPEGLVRRSLYAWIWLVDESGDTLGLYQMRDEAELTSVELGCPSVSSLDWRQPN